MTGCSLHWSSSPSKCSLFIILFFSSGGIKFSIKRYLQNGTKPRHVSAEVTQSISLIPRMEKKEYITSWVLIWKSELFRSLCNEAHVEIRKKPKQSTGRDSITLGCVFPDVHNFLLVLEFSGEFILGLFQLLSGCDVFINDVSHLPLHQL